jgi:hypothetical protein
MQLQKVISRKNCVKKLVFACILKVNDENGRIRIQDPEPDLLVRGMDPRIRIHPKMSWIRNTVSNYRNLLITIPYVSNYQRIFPLSTFYPPPS